MSNGLQSGTDRGIRAGLFDGMRKGDLAGIVSNDLDQHPQILKNGLIFNIDASNRGSYLSYGSEWKDLVIDNNATLINSPAFNQKQKLSYLTFNGSNKYGIIPTNSTFYPRELTFSCWINTQSLASTSEIFSSGNDIVGWYLEIRTSGALYFATSSFGVLTASGIISVNKWQFVTVVCSSKTISFYINDTLISQHSNTSSIIPYGSPSIIANWTSGSYYYNGFISQIFMYSRPLSMHEVAFNYKSTLSKFK